MSAPVIVRNGHTVTKEPSTTIIVAPQDQALRTKLVQTDPISVRLKSDISWWKPSDATAFYTLVLALATVVLAIITNKATNAARQLAKEAREQQLTDAGTARAQMEKDAASALAERDRTAKAIGVAILERLKKRMEHIELELRNNRAPLFGESDLQAPLNRLLQSDMEHAFGSAYTDVVRAVMNAEEASAALRGLREEANRIEAQVKEESRDPRVVLRWASNPANITNFESPLDADKIRPAYERRNLQVRIKTYEDSTSEVLGRMKAAIDSALQ